MKSLVVIMVAGLLALVGLYFVARTIAGRELRSTRSELVVRTQELESARAEVVQVKTEMQDSLNKMKAQVDTLAEEKNIAEEKISALSDDMRAVLHDLDSEKTTRRTLEERNVQLVTALDQSGQELGTLKQRNSELQQNYTSLQGSYDKTREQFAAMREDYVALTRERDELLAQFNDLDALRQQIRTVKIDLRNERIEEWKRSDRIAAGSGNGGFLMQGGQWKTVGIAEEGGSKFPLVEEIRREP